MDAIITAVAALVVGFGGALLGAWLTGRHQQAQRRAEFLEHQLRDFYSPLVSLLDRILAKTRLRVRLRQAAREDPRVQGDEFTRLIQYDNRQFVEEIIPAYQGMLAVFRDNLWLAEPETRSHFPALIEFVEIWDRWLNAAIPDELIQLVGHSEEPLHPFYDHLRRKHDELQAKISQGGA